MDEGDYWGAIICVEVDGAGRFPLTRLARKRRGGGGGGSSCVILPKWVIWMWCRMEGRGERRRRMGLCAAAAAAAPDRYVGKHVSGGALNSARISLCGGGIMGCTIVTPNRDRDRMIGE